MVFATCGWRWHIKSQIFLEFNQKQWPQRRNHESDRCRAKRKNQEGHFRKKKFFKKEDVTPIY
jgi:hypothetical protein